MISRSVKKLKTAALAMIVSAVSIAMLALPASADYALTNNELYEQSVPDVFSCEKVISSVNNNQITFSNPQDLYVDTKDDIYVADTGNNRVVELDPNCNFVRVYPSTNADARTQMSQPTGVYVDQDGDLYVADTGNGRILHINASGDFVEQFSQPKEETYDKSVPFAPTKIDIDKFGIMYIVNGNDYRGILTLDAQGHFLGYIATDKIGFDLADWLLRRVATEDQIKQILKKVPSYFSNVSVNPDGTIYATSVLSSSNQIKRLTPAGTNVYPGGFYGQENNQKTFNNLPAFADIAVNSNGIVFAADQVRERIYIYDQDGNNVAVFGGTGYTQLNFESISGMALNSKNTLYVLDRQVNTIQVLKPTEFLQNILSAVTLYNKGEYTAALTPWKKVMKIDPTYMMGEIGVAKSELHNGQMSDALNVYRTALDKKGYSDAFEQLRMDNFRNHFGLIVFILLAALIALYFIIKYLRRFANKTVNGSLPKRDRFGVKFFVETIVSVLFHPIDTFYRVKQNRRNLKIWPIALMLLLMIIEMVVYQSIIHFPLAGNVVYVDYKQILFPFFGMLISWIVMGYAITSISDGKQTFIESTSAILYAFTPYMIFYLPLAALSNLMSMNDAGLYFGLQNVLIIWSLALVFCQMKILNEYSFWRAVWTVFKILFSIACLWLIIFMFYIVLNQLFTFVNDVYTEFVYMSR